MASVCFSFFFDRSKRFCNFVKYEWNRPTNESAHTIGRGNARNTSKREIFTVASRSILWSTRENPFCRATNNNDRNGVRIPSLSVLSGKKSAAKRARIYVPPLYTRVFDTYAFYYVSICWYAEDVFRKLVVGNVIETSEGLSSIPNILKLLSIRSNLLRYTYYERKVDLCWIIIKFIRSMYKWKKCRFNYVGCVIFIISFMS